jgi:hypothetical protein
MPLDRHLLQDQRVGRERVQHQRCSPFRWRWALSFHLDSQQIAHTQQQYIYLAL